MYYSILAMLLYNLCSAVEWDIICFHNQKPQCSNLWIFDSNIYSLSSPLDLLSLNESEVLNSNCFKYTF